MSQWKESIIISIPQKACAEDLNDYRLIALTSVLCKRFEKVVCELLPGMAAEKLNPLQFAYEAKRGVVDASLTLLDPVARHLDSCDPLMRISLMDVSFVFNTADPNILLHHLVELEVHPLLILLVQDFLSDWPQHVLVNVGLPQGCVLSPILFAIYTNNIRYNSEEMTLLNYADDMALVAHLTSTDALSDYKQTVDNLVQSFKASSLELCLGSREKVDSHPFPALQHQWPAGKTGRVLQILGDSDRHLPVLLQACAICLHEGTAAPPPAEEASGPLMSVTF